MAERIFVYGTLRPGKAPREVSRLVNRFTRVGPGQVRGKLFNLGAYPGVVLDRNASPVQGEVFLLPDDPKALPQLDAYEEFLPEDPDASLFIRQKTRVTLDSGKQATCWIYVYNQANTAPALATVA